MFIPPSAESWGLLLDFNPDHHHQEWLRNSLSHSASRCYLHLMEEDADGLVKTEVLGWPGRGGQTQARVSQPPGGALGMAAWIFLQSKLVCVYHTHISARLLKGKYLDMHACMLNHFSHV